MGQTQVCKEEIHEASYTFNVNVNKIARCRGKLKMGPLEWHVGTSEYPRQAHKITVRYFTWLQLIGLPNKWDSVTVKATAYCEHTNRRISWMSKYGKDTKQTLRESVILSSRDMEEHNVRNISFSVMIKIIQIQLVNDNQVYYHLNVNCKQYEQIQWKLHRQILDALKNRRLCVGTTLSNDSSNSMWTIHLTPNGLSRNAVNKCSVWLTLCEMPLNMKQMTVKWTVSISELNYQNTVTNIFGVTNVNHGVVVGSFRQQFMNCNDFTINISIHILQAIDMNNETFDIFNNSQTEELTNLQNDIVTLQQDMYQKQMQCKQLCQEQKKDKQQMYELQQNVNDLRIHNVELNEKNIKMELLLKKQEESLITLNNVLVVIICVGEYDKVSEENTLNPLPGTQVDKQRLTQLFKQKYKYQIIRNLKPYVTHRDIDNILSTARTKFTEPNKYDAVMVFYSGHGDQYNLFLSEWNDKTNEYYKYDRNDFEANFNGKNAPSKAQSFKFFFIDSCRGTNCPKMIDIGTVNDKAGGDDKYIHPEKHRCIMHANPKTYKSYEVPYDEKENDIAWDKMDDDVYDDTYCGIFMNAVYHAFNQNVADGFRINFSDIQDNIRDKASGAVPLKNDKKCKVGLEIDESGALLNRDKRRIIFGCHEQNDVPLHDQLNIECL